MSEIFGGQPGKHLDDQQLIDAYYGDLKAPEHLSVCAECRGRAERLRQVLDAFHHFPIPERGPDHGSAAWAKLLPKLPEGRPRQWWSNWTWSNWTFLAPALAALLTVAFLTGRFAERRSFTQPFAQAPGPVAGISETARERVLLMSLSDHLGQAQIVLSNVVNDTPGSSDIQRERDRAHELIGANRLLRQTATRLGDRTDAALLEELERVLIDFANSPPRSSASDLERTQEQIDQRGLLFKVRVGSVASRERGEKL